MSNVNPRLSYHLTVSVINLQSTLQGDQEIAKVALL